MSRRIRPSIRPLLLATAAWTLITNSPALHAETLEGTLEKGATWSSLFTYSEGSGDSIGQVFRNQSPIGKAILANCLPDMVCQLERAKRRNMDTNPPQEFKSNASGWFEITAGQQPHMIATISQSSESFKTRQGTLTVGEDNTLRLRGKPILPQVQGNNFLNLLMHYEIGQQDVILLQNSGGGACPALYQFVILQAGSAKATPEFGSCSDIMSPRFDGQQTITIDMVGKTAMSKETYRFAQGRVLHRGKEIK